MQQILRLAALNFALAVFGLYQLADWHATRQSQLLQWTQLELALRGDLKSPPDLLALAHDQRVLAQSPLAPFYATYALLYVVMMLPRLLSYATYDQEVLLRDLAAGALYALLAALLYVFLASCWSPLAHNAAWALYGVTVGLICASLLSAFQKRQRDREAAQAK